MLTNTRKEYWERKILARERLRYSALRWLLPTSWTIRQRLERAALLVERISGTKPVLLDLGCGSGLLGVRLRGLVTSYHGIDWARVAIAAARERDLGASATFEEGDVLAATFPAAEITVFLGLLDWLEDEERAQLFSKLASRDVVFSFTEAVSSYWHPYYWYRRVYDRWKGGGRNRASSHSAREIRENLSRAGYRIRELLPLGRFDPGRLVWARKDTAGPARDKFVNDGLLA